MRRSITSLVTVAAVCGGFAVAMSAAAGAQAAPSKVYVAPHANHSASWHCRHAAYHSVQAAVNAVRTGGTVIVCAGTYHEGVTIARRVDLEGRPGAIIDAKHQPYGVGIAASWSTVRGLKVMNADAPDSPADGIITAGFIGGVPKAANHVKILDNVTAHNAGAGIDVNSSSHSLVSGNNASHNGIGVNMANDLGAPSSYNLVRHNLANDNPGGCGLVLADHTGSGIFGNKIIGNVADRNGLGTPSAPNASSGSGIILAGGSGGVYDNTVAFNRFNGNGHGGVALHAHAPNLNFSGNLVAFNQIGTNNVRTDFADLKTTGIYLGDVSRLKIIIVGNRISNNYYGIFTAGPVTVIGRTHNQFHNVHKRFGSVANYGG
jgi:nitrous oxidase accessory protein NosD